MEQPVRIRPFEPADVHDLARVYLDSARHHAAIDPERYVVPPLQEVLDRYRHGRQHPAAARSITLVAVRDNEVVGFLDAWLQRPMDLMHRPTVYCYIADIGVAGKLRGSGIGAMLMSAAEDWGRREGGEYTSLEYNTNNPGAGRFYKRLGYRGASVTAIKPL